MAEIEKGRPVEGSPIPKCVLADNSEYTPHQYRLQLSRLIRLYAVGGPLAEALTPLVFLGGMRS